jgi:hypothetical protein
MGIKVFGKAIETVPNGSFTLAKFVSETVGNSDMRQSLLALATLGRTI